MITIPIPESNLEYCRDAVAIILKQNLDLQYQYGYNPDAEIETVYVEATNPTDFTALSIINVGIDNVAYSNKNYGGSVTGSSIINVDVYCKSKTTAGSGGDVASRLKATKLLALARYILEDPIYKTLGFDPGFIHGVSVESYGMADPEKYDTNNVSMGRLVFSVILTEDNSLITNPVIEGQDTKVLIGTTEDGFKYVL